MTLDVDLFLRVRLKDSILKVEEKDRVSQIASRLVKNPVIEEAPLNDELMLFDPTSSNFYVLNRTMTFTWSRIANGSSVDEIAHEMQDQFGGCTPAEAESDVQKAIDDLIALGLLTDTTTT